MLCTTILLPASHLCSCNAGYTLPTLSTIIVIYTPASSEKTMTATITSQKWKICCVRQFYCQHHTCTAVLQAAHDQMCVLLLIFTSAPSKKTMTATITTKISKICCTRQFYCHHHTCTAVLQAVHYQLYGLLLGILTSAPPKKKLKAIITEKCKICCTQQVYCQHNAGTAVQQAVHYEMWALLL